jgi:hypothetical protein
LDDERLCGRDASVVARFVEDALEADATGLGDG